MSEARHESAPQHSLGEILSGVASDIQGLVRGEIALARAEFDQSLHRILIGAIWLLGGALVAFAGLVVLLQGVAAALATALPTWAASLIIGAVIIVIGAIFARSGLSRISLKALTPNRTAANLQQDARVLKEHT